MAGTLELATRLRSLDEAGLAWVIESHGLSEERVDDYFDLAERALAPAAVQRALGELDRAALAALAVAAEHGESSVEAIGSRLTGAPVSTDEASLTRRLLDAEALCLVELHGDAVAVFEPVARRLAEWPAEGLPDLARLVDEPRPEQHAGPPPEGADERSGARAFATVTAVAELVESLRVDPARELQRGGLAQPDERRLAMASGREPGEVAQLLTMAERAELVALEGREWLVTERALEWMSRPTLERWAQLADPWRAALPDPVRRLLVGEHASWDEALLEVLAWEHPASPRLTRDARALLDDAEALGLAVDGVPTLVGRRLASDAGGASDALAPFLPTEVDTVYVQHDLTIVAPGPLDPAIDSRLRGMAELEHRVPASTYRVTPASVNRAIAAGESAASITAFLTRISLTGIPQPLEYLITEASERHGRLRVAPAGQRGSLVRSDDAALLDTLGVDQALRPLGLRRESAWRLVSPQPRDVVYWALLEARYPAVAEESDGSLAAPARERIAVAPRRHDDAAQRLAARLIAARGDEPGAAQAWAARQLEAAIRSRLAVAVTLRMPDGTTTERDFEPLGVSGGRVRGRDRSAGVERTFPLASVESVRPSR